MSRKKPSTDDQVDQPLDNEAWATARAAQMQQTDPAYARWLTEWAKCLRELRSVRVDTAAGRTGDVAEEM
jgi:hypothetical protein